MTQNLDSPATGADGQDGPDGQDRPGAPDGQDAPGARDGQDGRDGYGRRPAAVRGPGIALAAALLGFFLITLDALIVNVALPSIGRDLGGGITALQWVVDGYALTFAALLLSAGSVSDRIGARRAFAAGCALFVAASAGCGLAPGAGVLVAARFVQGAGAAIVLPTSLALIRESFPDPGARTRAIALWAMGGSLGSAAGPVCGGVLSQAGWRWIFFVNVPVGVAALLLLTRVAPSPRRPVPFDRIGQAGAVLAMAGLTYGLIEGGADGFTRPRTVAALAVAATAFAAFLVAQTRVAHPMVPPSLLRSRAVVTALAVGFAVNAGVYGMLFLFSLYFQQARGMSTMATGLAFLPMTALTAVMSPVAGRVIARVGVLPPLVIGTLLPAAGLAALAAAVSGGSIALLIALTVPIGAGGPLAVTAITALMLDSVPAAYAGTASGVLNACRQLGGALAVAVFGALLSGPSGVLHGLRLSLAGCVLLLAGSAVISLLLRGTAARA